MKYLCFLAYMFINLVNCRFFVTSDYSLQKQVQYTPFFCFYAAVFIKAIALFYIFQYLQVSSTLKFYGILYRRLDNA